MDPILYIKHENKPGNTRTDLSKTPTRGAKPIPTALTPGYHETLQPGTIPDQRTPYRIYFNQLLQECQGQPRKNMDFLHTCPDPAAICVISR